MPYLHPRLTSVVLCCAAMLLWTAGCTRSSSDNSTTAPSASTNGTTTESSHGETGGHAYGHDHSDWWCAEHGVPEEVCGQCNSKLAAEFQKKKDWCEEHDRPDSQCFICHPEHEARFAAQYEAKYGKKPPQPQ